MANRISTRVSSLSSPLWMWAVFVILGLPALSCQAASPAKPPDAANATYTIDRQSIALLNGSAEQSAAPGSATKIVTELSDKQAGGDVSGDGKPDVAVVLIHAPGGSGTFYYVAAVLNDGTEKGKTTNAELLGDRISVDKLNVVDSQIVVDYLDRRSGEPMATPPSVKATKKFALKDGKLVAAQ